MSQSCSTTPPGRQRAPQPGLGPRAARTAAGRTQASQGARRRACCKQHNAVLVAHYYVDGDLQDLALETGGCVADSLEMARFGRDHAAQTLVVAGVRFMGETAKILSPAQARADARPGGHLLARPRLPARRVRALLRRPPGPQGGRLRQHQRGGEGTRRLDGHQLLRAGHRAPPARTQGQKVLWAPDRHLGRYIRDETGADMLLWNGECIVHDEFKALELELMKREHPDALVLVHPESPAGVVALADVVGSTSQLIKAVVDGTASTYIVATDNGILHRMRQLAPGKTLLEAPTAGKQRHLQELRALPVDGDECGAGRDRLPGARPRRGRGARADALAGPGLHRTHAGLRRAPTRPASRSRSAASCRTSAARKPVRPGGDVVSALARRGSAPSGNSPAASAGSRGCSAGRGSRGASGPSARSARRSRPGCAVRAGRD